MPSYCPPPEQRRISLVDSLERTATPGSTEIFEREAETAIRSRLASRFHTSRIRNYKLINSLWNLLKIEPNWNSYGTPPPNIESVARATRILDVLANSGLSPEKVSASAEGGVAIIFTGVNRNRAIIESLNNNEFFLLLYDLEGRSKTIELADYGAERVIHSNLLSHLEGTSLAS